MKLKYEMEIIDMNGEQMAVPIDCDNSFRGVLRINDTTADILKLLTKDISEEKIVETLKKEYDASEEQLHRSVKKIIDMLFSEGLLIE